eukprot:scaffold875_cov120-Isochrysis_galbana.AAC.6
MLDRPAALAAATLKACASGRGPTRAATGGRTLSLFTRVYLDSMDCLSISRRSSAFIVPVPSPPPATTLARWLVGQRADVRIVLYRCGLGGKTVEEPVDAHRAVGAAAIVDREHDHHNWPRREAGEKRRQVRLTLTGEQSGSREGSATVSVPSRLARWESAHGIVGKGEGQGEVAAGTR